MGVERKWLVCCAALAFGEAIGFAGERFAALAPVVVALMVLWMLSGYGLGWRIWPYVAVFLAGVALSWGVVLSRRSALSLSHRPGPSLIRTLQLKVVDEPAIWTGRRGARKAVFDGVAGGARVRVEVPAELLSSMPRPGETWEVSGLLVGDPQSVLDRRRLYVRGDADSSCRRLRERTPIRAQFARVKADLAARIGWGLEHDNLAVKINRAMLLGERRLLDRADRELFVAAGTVHVFAISGLHVMVVARTLLYILLFMAVPVRTMAFLLLPAVWFYVIMVGLPPSALRAALMITCYGLAPVFWRRPNALVAWSAAFALVHVYDPSALLDVGSEMSFVVMLALVCCGRCLPANCGRFACFCAFSFSAWAAGVPIAAHFFGRLTPGGLLANLAVLPAAAVGVAAGTLGMLASYFSKTLAVHLNNISALMAKSMVAVSAAVAKMPFMSFETVRWSALTCMLWYAALALAMWLLYRRSSVKMI